MAETAETAGSQDTACHVPSPNDPADPPLIWERIERAAQLPKTTLTHQQIADAAIELADAEGLDAVTMRKLAEKLGVATMALYRYVTGKEELYELMVDTASFDTPYDIEGDADWYWRHGMHTYAKATRAAAFRHPWLMQASSQVVAMTPRHLASTEKALTVLGATGLDKSELMSVLRIVSSYVRGAVAMALSQRQLLRNHGMAPDDDPRLIFRDHMVWALGSGRYPRLTEVVMSGGGIRDLDAEFADGLDCLLDGIAARYGLA
jgi:AcrR family transcriptional regulator